MITCALENMWQTPSESGFAMNFFLGQTQDFAPCGVDQADGFVGVEDDKEGARDIQILPNPVAFSAEGRFGAAAGLGGLRGLECEFDVLTEFLEERLDFVVENVRFGSANDENAGHLAGKIEGDDGAGPVLVLDQQSFVVRGCGAV